MSGSPLSVPSRTTLPPSPTQPPSWSDIELNEPLEGDHWNIPSYKENSEEDFIPFVELIKQENLVKFEPKVPYIQSGAVNRHSLPTLLRACSLKIINAACFFKENDFLVKNFLNQLCSSSIACEVSSNTQDSLILLVNEICFFIKKLHCFFSNAASSEISFIIKKFVHGYLQKVLNNQLKMEDKLLLSDSELSVLRIFYELDLLKESLLTLNEFTQSAISSTIFDKILTLNNNFKEFDSLNSMFSAYFDTIFNSMIKGEFPTDNGLYCPSDMTCLEKFLSKTPLCLITRASIAFKSFKLANMAKLLDFPFKSVAQSEAPFCNFIKSHQAILSLFECIFSLFLSPRTSEIFHSLSLIFSKNSHEQTHLVWKLLQRHLTKEYNFVSISLDSEAIFKIEFHLPEPFSKIIPHKLAENSSKIFSFILILLNASYSLKRHKLSLLVLRTQMLLNSIENYLFTLVIPTVVTHLKYFLGLAITLDEIEKALGQWTTDILTAICFDKPAIWHVLNNICISCSALNLNEIDLFAHLKLLTSFISELNMTSSNPFHRILCSMILNL